MSKPVSQLDADGYFVGFAIADESPLEPGIFLLPGGCVDEIPPAIPDGYRAKWDGGSFSIEMIPVEESPPPTPPTLEELKAIKRAAINNERDIRETQGFTFMGKTFDSDQRSTDRIQMAALAAQSSILSGQQFNINWTTADNSIITLDAPLMLGLAAAFATYGATLHEIAKQLKAQVDAASSAAELEMIAWPS
jgi:hypothetical protein